MELSPDGRRIAFVAPLPGGVEVLWIRPLNGLSAQPLAGTEGASYPFWSPDGRFIGFFADGKLNKIEASGGPPQALCEAPTGRGGTWNRDGVILFAPSIGDPISRVSSSGGAASPVTEFPPGGTEGSHRWPYFLPNGKHFVYLALGAGFGLERYALFVGSLDSKERALLIHARSSAAYAPPGYLLFHREGALLARPFDAKRRRFTGEAFPVAERVHSPNTHKAVFSVSENGVLAYQAGEEGGQSQLVWLDRGGKDLEKVGTPANYRSLRLSHDGRRVALVVDDRGGADLWLYDLARRTSTRFTFDPANEASPVWSPDDRRIAFYSNRKGAGDPYWKNAAGTGQDEPVLESSLLKFPTDWSPDGRFLAFQASGPKTRDDLWIFSVAERKASLYLQTEFTERGALFSPDGRFLAYASNESGTQEVYVQPFPGPGGKWQISTSGGTQPAWSSNGRELFYLAPPNKLMAVEVRGGEAFEAGIPKLLFETRLLGGPGRRYDVSSDGQRFLVNRPIGAETHSPITLVVNWTAEVKP